MANSQGFGFYCLLTGAVSVPNIRPARNIAHRFTRSALPRAPSEHVVQLYIEPAAEDSSFNDFVALLEMDDLNVWSLPWEQRQLWLFASNGASTIEINSELLGRISALGLMLLASG